MSDFFQWCDESGLAELAALQPVHVAAYVESFGKTHSAPSVKQHLAAVRMLFDWLVVGQVVAGNPASVVRGPKHVVKRGKTPVLMPEEAHALFAAIPTDSLVGLRDRALLAILIYSFARISAAHQLEPLRRCSSRPAFPVRCARPSTAFYAAGDALHLLVHKDRNRILDSK